MQSEVANVRARTKYVSTKNEQVNPTIMMTTTTRVPPNEKHILERFGDRSLPYNTINCNYLMTYHLMYRYLINK